MNNEDDEIIKDFLIECNEHLDSLDNGFVSIEQNSSDDTILSAIFRSIHTIKGGAGMLAFNKLERLTHAAENLLSLLRDGKLSLNTQITTTLLQTVDSIRTMLGCIAQTGQDGEEEYNLLIEILNELQSDTQTSEPSNSYGEEELQTNSSPQTPDHQEEHSNEAISIKSETEHQTELTTTPLTDTTIRINVELLDKLMNLVGELVLSRNQILQFISSQSNANFITVSQRLNLITSELQEGVMKTRMQPIGNVWGKLPRIVRDLATSCNKKVSIVMIGKETELDKTLIEAIKDPITHIVRNSVDHGIESPEKRLAAGKPEEGTLTLKAYHESGHVNIEINDDGGGISPDKVKEKALEKGLINSEQMARMNERDALNLIFLPGLSTAEQITNVSGRGVGMDVVRTNIERINGTIDIQSNLGQSTTLKIKIPLTLAIIPALTITCNNNRYAIPQVNLLELVRLDSNQIKQSIQFIKDIPIYKLRGKLLPLVYLAKELELNNETQAADDQDQCVNIIVLQAGETQFGLVVDQINDTQEIVVKPLNKLLKNICCFAGATIMGDGKISLILDVMGLARKAGILSTGILSTEKLAQTLNQAKQAQLNEGKKEILLLLKLGENNLMAVPLSKVDRIEEFPAKDVEKAGTQDVVQYRESIMPLVSLSQFINTHTDDKNINKDKILVIVYSQDQKNFGLIVDHIYDIVEGSFHLNNKIARRGVLGTTVVDNKVTEILDVKNIIYTVLPNFFTPEPV